MWRKVQYYLWLLERRGIEGAEGIIEYPRQRRRTEVHLDIAARAKIGEWLAEIGRVVAGDCPAAVRKPYCRRCAFYDFCYV